MTVKNRQKVLIVNPSADAREVMQFALDRRGVDTTTVATSLAGLDSARALSPDVIVLDMEALSGVETGHADFVVTARTEQSALLFVGDTRGGRDDSRCGDQIDKPYHFSALVNKIEELLTRQQNSGAAPWKSVTARRGDLPDTAPTALRRAA
jgi:DNA-binding response OmpR family regulator